MLIILFTCSLKYSGRNSVRCLNTFSLYPRGLQLTSKCNNLNEILYPEGTTKHFKYLALLLRDIRSNFSLAQWATAKPRGCLENCMDTTTLGWTGSEQPIIPAPSLGPGTESKLQGWDLPPQPLCLHGCLKSLKR